MSNITYGNKANISGKRHKISMRMDSPNKNLRSAYLNMQVAVKESLRSFLRWLWLSGSTVSIGLYI